MSDSEPKTDTNLLQYTTPVQSDLRWVAPQKQLGNFPFGIQKNLKGNEIELFTYSLLLFIPS